MKRIIITGATGAVGAATAKAMAAKGNIELVLLGRDAGKLDTLKKSIDNSNVKIETIVADLSDSDSVQEAIKTIKKNYQKIDGLVNIAAAYKGNKVMTRQNREWMFAINHLAPFAITTGLLEQIRSTPGSKILNVSAPSSTKVDFENLNAEKKFSALGAFGGTKMMNLLFSFFLAKKLNGTTHASIAFHPGLVKSNLLKESPAFVRGLFRLISSAPEKTADAITNLMLEGSTQNQNGKFYNKALKEMKAASFAYDDHAQKKLWEVSEKMLAGEKAIA